MNGIGENKLVAFLAGLSTLIVTAWLVPDALSSVTTAVVALFGMLIGKKKGE